MGQQEGVRKLTAILAADIVGYSRLMRADETGTLARLKALREELVDPTIAAHHGRIIKLMGDGLLAEFASISDAVACAIEIQRSLATDSSDCAEVQRLQFRIGINSGDVIVEGDDIYGDAVNIAARLETLSEPGGLCIPTIVFEEIRRDGKLGFADLGEQRVKNIPDPIRVYRVLLDPGQAGKVINARKQPPSLAVLPFDNLSRDYFLSYVCDGLSEDLINCFGRLHSLPVIARASSFLQFGLSDDAQAVADELKVSHILAGSVRCYERRVEIETRLIDVTSGDPIWSERFDQPRDELLSIRNEIIENVIITLNLTVPVQNNDSLTDKPEAYDKLLRACEMRATGTKTMSQEAVRTLEDAVVLAPNFAQGWLELAVTLIGAVNSGWVESAKASRERAFEAAKKAIAYDLSLGEAHTVLGIVLCENGETEQALREFEAGAAASPNVAWTLAMLAQQLTDHGRPTEGLLMIEQAFRLNPKAHDWYFEVRGWAYLALRRNDEAVIDFDAASAQSPDKLGPRLGLTVAHAEAGRLDIARAAAQEALRIAPHLTSDEARVRVIDPVLRERQETCLRRAGLRSQTREVMGIQDQKTDAMLNNWIEITNANQPPNLNPDRLAGLYAEDCIHIQPLRELPDGPFLSRTALRQFFATFDSHWTTLKLAEIRRLVQGQRAVLEALMEGIHKKSGKPIKVPIVFFIDFDEGGKVKKQHVYIDNGLVEEQIR